MHESIRKFLSIRISSKSLEEFNRNTASVSAFIVELEKVENGFKSFDGLNKVKYDELVNGFNTLKGKYDSIKHLLRMNQEIPGRMGIIESEIERYNKVIDFGSLIGSLKEKLTNIDDIDAIIREYNELKKIYDKNSKVIEKNERVAAEYNDISTKVQYLINNKEYFVYVIENLKDVYITDDTYSGLVEMFTVHKTKLEELSDEVFLPRVIEVLSVLENYEADLNKLKELQDKVQFVINRTATDNWGQKRYLTELKNLKNVFTSDFNNISITTKRFINSKSAGNCYNAIEEFGNRIDEIDNAIKKSRSLYSRYNDIKGLSNPRDIGAKITELKKDLNKFEYKDRFPSLCEDVEDIEKEMSGVVQKNAVKEINKIEDKVFARNASSITISTLNNYKNKVKDNYALLDSKQKEKVKYSQIQARIDSLIKKKKHEGRHDSTEYFYFLVFGLTAAFIVGYYFYNRFIGVKPCIWLFNNPPFFMHKWAHWGLVPWKWVESINVKDFLSFLLVAVVFIGSVICMAIFLIGEVLWFLITILAFAVAWLVLTILSILLHILIYAFPLIIVALGIIYSVTVKTKSDAKSPLWLIVCILLILALGTLAYLNKFGVLVF